MLVPLRLLTDARRGFFFEMTQNDLETRIQEISDETLLPYIRQLLPSRVHAILERSSVRVHGGTFGIIYRFQGKVLANDEPLPWSLILKVVRHTGAEPIDRSQPSSQRYWRREPLAYQSGFLRQLQGPLVAPRCFDVIQYTDNEFWLWLEDMGEAAQVNWSTEQYRLMARHIGQFNGAGFLNKDWLTSSWLGKDLHRAQAHEGQSDFVEHLPRVQHDPLVQRFLPDDTAQRIMALWRDREVFYTHLDQLPQTVCHRDACHVNLFARSGLDGAPQTVAIDWEDAAQGAIGEDLVSLVIVSLLSDHVAFDDSLAFDALVFESYLEGLQDSGWSGDAASVRLGYTAACIRYGLGLIHFIVGFASDEKRRSQYEERTGQSIEDTAARWAGVYRFILGRTDEARRLIALSS